MANKGNTGGGNEETGRSPEEEKGEIGVDEDNPVEVVVPTDVLSIPNPGIREDPDIVLGILVVIPR